MLGITRLAAGRRPYAPTSTAAMVTIRTITFATGKGNVNRPLTFTGGRGSTAKPSPTSSPSFFARPPSTWGPSTISTLALGSMLVGSWYIWEEGRSYKVAAEVDKYEPRVLGTHRDGRVNPDYLSYEQWVERHGHLKKK